MKEFLPILDSGVISSGWNLSKIKSLMQPRTHPLKIPSTVACLAYSETVYYIVVPCRCVILHAAANESDPQKSKPWSLRFRRRYKNIEEYTALLFSARGSTLLYSHHRCTSTSTSTSKHARAHVLALTPTHSHALALALTCTIMLQYKPLIHDLKMKIYLCFVEKSKKKSHAKIPEKGRRSKKPPPRKVEQSIAKNDAWSCRNDSTKKL